MLRKEVSESQRQTGAGNALEISMGQWALEKSCVPSCFPAIQYKRDKQCSCARRGSPAASRVKGHVPRCTMPILGGAAVHICRAFSRLLALLCGKERWCEVHLTTSKRVGPALATKKGGAASAIVMIGVRCQRSPGEGANSLAIGHVTCHGTLHCAC